MPIYEFYCATCHTVFSFHTPRVDPEVRPACPRCGRQPLERRPSRFAMLSYAGQDEPPDPLDALDDARLEGAMETLMHEMGDGEDEDDPRVMSRMMRRFSELSGLEMGERMEDMVRRLDAGEDPEALEDDLDGDDDALDDLFRVKQALRQRRGRPPSVDEELHFL